MKPFATLHHEELALLGAGIEALGLSEVDGEALHLEQLLGRRHWLIDSGGGQFTVEMPAPEALPGRHLPVSERVRRFAAAFPECEVSLTLVDDSTVLARADGASAAVDLVETGGHQPRVLRFESTASATVPLLNFCALMWSARTMPAGIDDPSYPLPPMWMQIADGSLGLHVDWSDFLPSRATYRVDATRHHGTATVMLPLQATDNFLRRVVDARQDALVDLEVTFSVGTASDGGAAPARPALRIEAHQWRLTLWLHDHLQVRWASRIERLLRDDSLEVDDKGDTTWTVDVDGTEVTIAMHSGHPDIARVSATIAFHAEETIELLRELGTLNAASTSTRYWYADGTVRAVSDVRCDHLDPLPAVVREVAGAARRYGPMLAHL